MVPEGCRLADVGTDHGYLPVYLLQRRRIRGAVAADIGAEPLAHARRTAEAYGVEGIDFRLCDGLRDIAPDEVDTVVIAGMGGETIIAILEGAAWTKDGAHTLLLQPMTKAADLRYWLAVNGYGFTEERLVWDKNYLYPVLRVTGGGTPQALTEGLRDGSLLPGLFLCFLEAHFLRDFTVFGGFYQPTYLAEMRRGLVRVLRETGGYEEEAAIIEAKRSAMTLGLIYLLRSRESGSFPVSTAELLEQPVSTPEVEVSLQGSVVAALEHLN